MQRRANTQNVSWFLEVRANGQLDLDPAYQRRSVWNDNYRRFYIDTVLRDFPSPAIYLDVEIRPGSPTVYHVIDGKQRLESLLGFSTDDFHLGNFLASEGLQDAYFSQLPKHWQEKFVGYVLNVEQITDASDAELTEAFDRLNRNVARLNSQELRNARFAGRFISKALDLAAHPFWVETGIATRTRIQRMLDVEFVSELYLLVMRGKPQDGKARVLDEAYALYDDEIPREEEADGTYSTVLSWLQETGLPWRQVRWSNQTDMYSLWAAALDLLPENGGPGLPRPSDAAARLQAFEAQLSPEPDAGYVRAEAASYLDAARQGSNKDSNRTFRASIITEVLTNPS
jgi:Protein of unknown function DUF262